MKITTHTKQHYFLKSSAFRVFTVSFFLLGVSVASHAQIADPSKLDDLAKQQEKAEAQAGELSIKQEELKKEIDGLQNDLVSQTSKSRGYERAAKEAEARLADLSQKEAALRTAILADRNRLTDLLASLQRIERKPPPALLASVETATDTARAASLIESLTGSLNSKTELLKAELVELHDVRQEIERNRLAIITNADEVATRLRGIKSVIANKSNLNSQLDKDRKNKIEEAQKLASQAQSLRDLIRSFEERANDIAPRIKPKRDALPDRSSPSPQVKPRRGQPPPVYVPSAGQRFADARGALPLPVLGRLSTAFGAKLTGGGRSKGVSLKTAKNAQVVAPFDGRVEFAGAFDEDYVVILNVGNGYFIVMTGLGDTFAVAGDSVITGEPLGTMPKRSKASPELFMEFRKDRASIDPAPWIGTALAQAR